MKFCEFYGNKYYPKLYLIIIRLHKYVNRILLLTW